jgi:hypothetical protein
VQIDQFVFAQAFASCSQPVAWNRYSKSTTRPSVVITGRPTHLPFEVSPAPGNRNASNWVIESSLGWVAPTRQRGQEAGRRRDKAKGRYAHEVLVGITSFRSGQPDRTVGMRRQQAGSSTDQSPTVRSVPAGGGSAPSTCWHRRRSPRGNRVIPDRLR